MTSDDDGFTRLCMTIEVGLFSNRWGYQIMVNSYKMLKQVDGNSGNLGLPNYG